MCVFTYVQSLCHSLSKIEKERKDKENEEKDKAADEGEKGGDGTEEKQGDVTETREAGEEENAPNSCEMEQDGGVLVEAES